MPLPQGSPQKKRAHACGEVAAAPGKTHKLLNLFRTSLLLQVFVGFLLVLAIKWPVLHDPPVWDTAMSVFPAAITLEQYGFDLPRLLKEPSYAEAGPNVHADSVVTLITALIIRLTGETSTFLPTLHLLHFLITALTLVAAYRYGRPILGETVSLVSVLAILTFPLFLTQAGYLYLEIPLAFTTMMAFLAWRNGHTYQAGFWTIISLWIKPTGILVGCALTVAAIMGPGGVYERCRRAAIISFLPVSFTLLRPLLAPNPSVVPLSPISEALNCFFFEFSRYLIRVPDLAVLLGLFLLGCGICHRRIWAGLGQAKEDDPEAEQNHWLALNCLVVVSFLLVIHVLAPITLPQCFGLPRYYTPILPFILMTLSFFLITLMSRKKTILLLTVSIGFFIINRNGIFYPSDVDQGGLFGNNFALTERSGAYHELARLQREAMRSLEQLPPGVPIYFGHYEDYLNRYPAMGYVNATIPNAESIARWDDKRMKELWSKPPECIYFLYNYPFLGGERIQALVGKLKATHRSETVRTFRSGEHKIILHRMRTASSACRGESP